MTNHSLEDHLKQLCEEHPEYTSLLSTWNLSKVACVDALKTVVTTYPHFSLHDISHSEAVITKIEMLLGDRVEKLSPTDTWLILHAAYAHDLGMVLKWEDIEGIWEEPKFARFLQSAMDSLDTDLRKAAKNIDALLKRTGNACIDPLKISRNVTLVNAAYFRKYHSEISRKYIDLWEDGLGIDFSHSGLIQSRLVKLLGLICELHTADSDEVLIYGDPFVCFREIIQNAMDASKLQMWKDLTAGNYAAWISAKEATENTQPFDIDKAIFSNYAIHVKLSTLADGRTQVDITDRGTGISAAQFKQMCNVGTSTSLNGDNEAFIATMPGWLKPTAGFGIGLQSIFLLVDDFEMITSTGTEAFVATVHSYRAGGYLQLKRKNDIPARGTTVRIKFDAKKYYQPMIEETRRYIYGKYDPFDDEDYVGEYKVIGSILKNCGDLMFPVRITSSVEEYQDAVLLDALNIDEAKYGNRKDTFRFSLSKDCCSLIAWDEKFHIHADIKLVESERTKTEIRFKGVKVARASPIRRVDGLNIIFDVYGLETKETLALDRVSFINPGRTIIRERAKATVNFYLDRVLDELNSSPDRLAGICGNEKFDVYIFWKLCSPVQRNRIPKECYSYIKEAADIVSRSADGKYALTTKPVSDILTHTGKTYFASYRDYDEINITDQNRFREICDLLNKQAATHVDEFVVDGSLTNTNGSHIWDSMIKPIKDNNLIIYTTGTAICCEVSPDFRKDIICGLAGPVSGVYYYGDMVKNRKYYAIPAVCGYEDIAISQVPRGVAMPYTRTNLILAPFTSQLGSKISEMSKEMFISSVMEDSRFERIVAYVQKCRVNQTAITLAEIRDSYRKLIEEYYDTMEAMQ